MQKNYNNQIDQLLAIIKQKDKQISGLQDQVKDMSKQGDVEVVESESDGMMSREEVESRV